MPHDAEVLFLDDDQDVRDAVTEILRAVMDRDCVGVASYRELVALGGRALCCGIAILDINLGPGAHNGLDAYAWLRKNGYAGRIIFLSGHAISHPLLQEASRLGDAQVIAKPISFETFSALIEGNPLPQERGALP